MCSAKEASERREVYFSGRVQGVGFRYTTRQIASRYAVRGFVKNLHDGRVVLVVEGDAGELERFLAAVEAELDRHIEHRESAALPASGEFTGFEVRY